MKNIFDSPALKAIRALDDSAVMRAIRAIEDSPSIRMMRELNESPAVRAMRQLENSPAMQAIRQFEESPAIRMMRDLEDSPALKAIKGLEESPAFKAIQQLQESPALRALRALETSPAMEAFSRITEQINHGYGALTFSEAYELIADEYEKQPDLGTLDTLSGEVQNRASRAPLGVLSAEFYINVILALFLFYLSQMTAQESEARMLERMNGLEQTITTQLEELRKFENDRHFLFADRSLNLRFGPGTDHDVIGNISRNQKLMELERDRDWVKVEYFDHTNNVDLVGWAHSRYLLKITPGDQG
jgi:hypothetical protein